MVEDTVLFTKLDTIVFGRFINGERLRFKNKEIEDWCKFNLVDWDLHSEFIKLEPYHQSRYIYTALLFVSDECSKVLFKLIWLDGKTDFYG